MERSKFMRLNWRDMWKAFLLAFIAFVLNFLQETFVPSLGISAELKLIIITGLGYLGKNFFESEN